MLCRGLVLLQCLQNLQTLIKQYLATCSTFNEGVYSEDIDRSDFTCHSAPASLEVADDESVANIFAPIYPDPTVPSEGHQQPLEIASENIREEAKIGTGQYGDIVLAKTSLRDVQLITRDDDQRATILTVEKKLNPNPSQTQNEVFDKEIKFISQLRHPNVASLLGVCYGEPAFIMMEYVGGDNLNQFLKRHTEIVSSTTPSSDSQLTTPMLVSMASQISSVMQYLAERNFVHRDIASRNCLVGKDLTIKVADLGMNKDLYQSHYYRIRDSRLLPIRWMATECLMANSQKSQMSGHLVSPCGNCSILPKICHTLTYLMKR